MDAYSSVNDVLKARAEQRTYSHRRQQLYGLGTYYAHAAPARIGDSHASMSASSSVCASTPGTTPSASSSTYRNHRNYDLDYLLKTDSFLPATTNSQLEEIREICSHGVLAQENNITLLSQGSGITPSSIVTPRESILSSVISSVTDWDDKVGLHDNEVNTTQPSTTNTSII